MITLLKVPVLMAQFSQKTQIDQSINGYMWQIMQIYATRILNASCICIVNASCTKYLHI